MKGTVRLLAAACLALVAPTSRADTPPTDLATSFIKLCGETSGDAARALAAADQEGWTAPATALQPPASDPAVPVHWTDLEGRFLRWPAGLLALEVGAQSHPGGRSAHSCTLIDWGKPHAGSEEWVRLREALARWVGGEPVNANESGDFAKFAFRVVGGKRQPLSPGNPALSADLPPAGVTEVTLTNALGKPLILYMTWR
jgi:hypothetical protein